MIGISLVICSLDRVVPLYKALKAQRVTRHEGFLKRQTRIWNNVAKLMRMTFLVVKEH